MSFGECQHVYRRKTEVDGRAYKRGDLCRMPIIDPLHAPYCDKHYYKANENKKKSAGMATGSTNSGQLPTPIQTSTIREVVRTDLQQTSTNSMNTSSSSMFSNTNRYQEIVSVSESPVSTDEYFGVHGNNAEKATQANDEWCNLLNKIIENK